MKMATCHPDRKHVAHGLCRSCHQNRRYAADPEFAEARRERTRQYRAANREAINARRRAKWVADPVSARCAEMRGKYGIPAAEVDRMLTAQGGQCAICLQDITGRTKARPKAAVDHCHTTGKVRGLLCFRCNSSLGAFGDDPATLRRAITYLARTTVVELT